jgi:hypothetical protein
MVFRSERQANTACTRPLDEHQDGRGGTLRVRVFRQSAWLAVGSGKVALSRPAHLRVTQAVGRFL